MKNNSNIEVIDDNDKHVIFKTTCSCSSNDHTVDVIVDKSENKPIISLYFTSIWCDDYYLDSLKLNFFKRTISRLKAMWKILISGRLSISDEFIFRSDKHLQDFQEALNEAVNQLKK